MPVSLDNGWALAPPFPVPGGRHGSLTWDGDRPVVVSAGRPRARGKLSPQPAAVPLPATPSPLLRTRAQVVHTTPRRVPRSLAPGGLCTTGQHSACMAPLCSPDGPCAEKTDDRGARGLRLGERGSGQSDSRLGNGRCLNWVCSPTEPWGCIGEQLPGGGGPARGPAAGGAQRLRGGVSACREGASTRGSGLLVACSRAVRLPPGPPP